jgi:RHS repeat-associated protein
MAAKTRMGPHFGVAILSTKWLDEETGLFYYGFRYFAPGLGRWVSRDPIEEDGGVSALMFCGNNGINEFDPFGTVASDLGVEWKHKYRVGCNVYRWGVDSFLFHGPMPNHSEYAESGSAIVFSHY